MKTISFVKTATTMAFCAAVGSASAGNWSEGIKAAAESLARQAERQSQMEAEYEAQRKLLELQHQLEMQRMDRHYELQERERQEAARRAAAARASQQRPPPEEIQRRLAEVERAHPGWRRLTSTPSFENWVNNSPPYVRTLRASWEPADTINLITIFKREMNMAR